MANAIGAAGEAWTEVYAVPFNGIVKLISGSPKAIGCVGSSIPSGDDVGFTIDRIGTNVVVLAGEALYLRSYRGVVEVTMIPFDRGGSPSDYFYNAALGRMPGVSTGFVVGQNNKTSSTGFDSVTDQGGKYTYLTENTQLYVSSTDSLDTDIDILMQGLDDDYNPVTLTATTSATDGQAQIPLSSIASFRVHVFLVSGTKTPVGELYLSEASALTGGIPDDATKIKAKIPLSTDTNGNIVDGGTIYASDNFSHLGLVTVPAGKIMLVTRIILGTRKDDDVKIGGRIRPPGGVFKWFNRNPVPVYQSNVVLEFNPPIVLPEKNDLDFMAIGGSPESLAQVQVLYVLEDA